MSWKVFAPSIYCFLQTESRMTCATGLLGFDDQVRGEAPDDEALTLERQQRWIPAKRFAIRIWCSGGSNRHEVDGLPEFPGQLICQASTSCV